MKIKSIQHQWEKPIKFSLTPEEIMILASDCSSNGFSAKSELERLSHVAEDIQSAQNPRTGLQCHMFFVALDSGEADDEQRDIYRYIVELNTGNGYVLSCFESKTGTGSEMSYLRKEAEKTFITWSGLIGVKVEYKLCALVPVTCDC